MVLDFIEILKVIFLGIVEGITEWLPISSTGHMILVDEFITLNMSEAFKEMFFVVIQLGAILAVVVMFWNKMFPLYYRVVVIRAPLQGLVLHCKRCCGLVLSSYHKMVLERFQPQPLTLLLIS